MTQLYNSVQSKNLLDEIHRIEECINCVQKWLNDNMLMLNGPKTDFMIVSKASALEKIEKIEMNLNSSVISPAKYVKNLGVSVCVYRYVSNLIYLCCIGCCYCKNWAEQVANSTALI